jgi:hypothetical protein
MAKFLFVYRSNTDAAKQMRNMPPEQMQQIMQQWGAWIGEAMQKGWMVDPGDGLTDEGKTVTTKVVSDGPFVEAKEIVGGYSVVEADTIEKAAEFAKGCPALLGGGSVEVRRLAGLSAQL